MNVSDGFLIVAETLLWGRGVGVRMSHNVVVLLNIIMRNRPHVGHVPYSIFNPSLCHFSPFHLDLCRCFKAMSFVGILP